MKQKNLILLIIAAALILGGFFYMQRPSSTEHMDEDEMHIGEDGHHDDDDVVEAYEIYPGDLVDKIKDKEDIILLDVRTEEEYAEVHLENALLLPVQELAQSTLDEMGLGQDAKDKEIYVYCRSGSRSQTAYNILSSLGYTNVKSVAGGMIHWQEDEYPFTESGEYTPQTLEGKDQATGPDISIEKKSYDFGQIHQFGGTVEHEFTVKNTGSEVLEIGQLTTSCSCTSATISSSSIKAGESAVLTVVFDPNFHDEPAGVFKRTVFIPSNDSDTPEAEISIQVDILEGE